MQVRCDRCDEFECICGDPAFEQYLVDQELEEDDADQPVEQTDVPSRFTDPAYLKAERKVARVERSVRRNVR